MIVLINPRYQVSYQPPLGLAYIAAYLKKQGQTDVQIIDTTFDRLEEKLAKITKPDIFGIYIMAPYYTRAYRTVEFLKRKYPGMPIIAGGPHPTVDPSDVLNRLQIPICVRGEGEHTFYELVNAIKGDLDLSDIRGISYVDSISNKIIHTPDRSPIANLDGLPFPSRELIPMERYLRGGTQRAFSYRNLRATTIVTSRGCAFNCSYCQPTLDRIFGKKVRFRSVNSIIDEITHLVHEYSIQAIFLVDDTFTCNKSFVMQFCEEILRRKLDIKFAINSRVDTIDEEMLTMLKKAGVITIMYGIESGNQKVLDSINKKITIEQIRKAVLTTKQKGINVYGYFMIGSPEESLSSLKDTFGLARKLPFDEVQFSMAAPYKGTHLYNEAKSSDLIADPSVTEKSGYFSSAAMRSRYLSLTKIAKIYRYLSAFSRLKSIKNIIMRHPFAILSLLLNRVFLNRSKT